VNGDGKVDLVCPTTGALRLSTGRGFAIAASVGAFCTGAKDQLVSADLDGDGMVDWICNREGAPADDIVVRPGTASGPGAPRTWDGGWCQGQLFPIDFNGDRKADLLCDEAVQSVGQAGTPGLIADLMASVRNGRGGVESVEYRPSTAFPSANNPGAMYVVVRATIDDGRGGLATSTFDYAGARVDRAM